MVQDARQRTKTFVDTYLRNTQLTRDNDSTEVKFITAFGKPNYPLTKVFKSKKVDLVFSVGVPNSTPMMDPVTQTPYGYEERVPIETFCIDKTGITGTKLQWKAAAELRYITETYPTGSQRSFEAETPNEVNLGSTILYSQRFTLNYRRDTT